MPVIVATRRGASPGRVSPASFTASRAATRANCAKRSSMAFCRSSKCSSGLKPFTSPTRRVKRLSGGTRVISASPERPAVSASQVAATF
jgi:hypothetical protein